MQLSEINEDVEYNFIIWQEKKIDEYKKRAEEFEKRIAEKVVKRFIDSKNKQKN